MREEFFKNFTRFPHYDTKGSNKTFACSLMEPVFKIKFWIFSWLFAKVHAES